MEVGLFAELPIRLITEPRPALVVLRPYGKSWLREVFQGSVTTSLLRQFYAHLFPYH